MTGEEMERAIAFLLNQQAKFEARQQILQESLTKLTQAQAEMIQTQAEMRELMQAGWNETRAAINQLIVGIESTRTIAERAGLLAVNNSKRLTKVEGKVEKLEKKKR